MTTVLSTVERISKLVAIVVAAAAFAWGVWWSVFQHFDAKARDAETRRLEAMSPFLERQLKLYMEVAQLAATIATTTDDLERSTAISKFRLLQYGELALVQDGFVAAAVSGYAKGIDENATPEELQRLSYMLAKQCRESLARSWGVDLWRDPDELVHEERLQLLIGD